MRIAISLPFAHADGTAYRAPEIMHIARRIEDAGFDGIWIADVVGRGRRGNGEPYPPRPDPLMWLAIAGAATTRVELGTAVLQVPVRQPVDLAQRLMTLYALTGGRFTAGVGAGSSEPEFAGAGIAFEDRFRVFRKNLSIIRSLLRGEQVGETHLRPWKDAIPGPPILIGAWGSGVWIRRAAREYDGWLGSGGGPGGATFGGLKEGIRRFRDEGGKRAIAASVGVDLKGTSKPLAGDTGLNLRCGPDEARDRLAQVQALGFDDILLRNDALTEDDVEEVSQALGLKRRAG